MRGKWSKMMSKLPYESRRDGIFGCELGEQHRHVALAPGAKPGLRHPGGVAPGVGKHHRACRASRRPTKVSLKRAHVRVREVISVDESRHDAGRVAVDMRRVARR